MPAAPARIAPPTSYEIGDLVGAGGMGVVYAARHPAVPADLVMKVLRPELSGDPGVRARFAAEVTALARLDHPGIVRYVDSGDDFLVMERVAGVPLGTLIASSGLLPLSRVLAICGELLHALAHAHARGVVHGDIKCDNLLVETDAGTDRVTLIDFGVAQLPDEPACADPMISGTPEYMAPEVIRGEPASPAADLYAVGVVLYELLTGATPFSGGSSDAILLRHLDEEVVPPSLRRPDRSIPPVLERIVMRALAKDPARRFTSAGTLGVALQDAARGNHDVAEPATTELAPAAFSTEAPTCEWTADDLPPPIRSRRLARGTGQGPNRAERARVQIGDAIIRGNPCDIAAGYLELARVLVDERRLEAAVRELEESLDVLAGPGPEPHAEIALWPVLLTTAAVHDGLGDRGNARTFARKAYEDARCAGSILGMTRATTLLARLEPGRPRSRAQSWAPPVAPAS